MKLTIIGAGKYGRALGAVAASSGHAVMFVSPELEVSLDEGLREAEAIVIAAPSSFVKGILEELRTSMPRPIIIASKGLFPDDATAGPLVSALAGAGFAAQLAEPPPTILTASSPLARDLFHGDTVRVELTDDTAGILLCGSLKNIYAVGSGLLHLEPRTSVFANYIQMTITEMKQALTAFNCDPHTADFSCGIADLIMTCASDQSRNYAFGRDIAQNPDYQPAANDTIEGRAALQHLPEELERLPIIATIRNIVLRQQPLDTLSDTLFSRI